MFNYQCDYSECKGHDITIKSNLLCVVMSDGGAGKGVRFFASVDCALFFFAQFPPGMLFQDTPGFLAKNPKVLAKPRPTEDEVNE